MAKKKILIVEDDKDIARLIQYNLDKAGYDCEVAGTGEVALTTLARHLFDLIILDVMLPGISGSDLADHLKIRWPDLKIILMSGYTEDVAVRRGVRNKRLRFLQKPFDMRALGRELRAVLEEPN